MEEQENTDSFLSHRFSIEESGIKAPPHDLVAAARKRVQSRKKEYGEFSDFFAIIAGFLNMKIKLYHAVIACMALGIFILLFNGKGNNTNKPEARSGNYVSNIAAVQNSTVLSSINTFVTYK